MEEATKRSRQVRRRKSERRQTAGSAELEDEEQGEDEAAQEALPDAGAEEDEDFGFEVGVEIALDASVAEPGAEGGARDVVVAGVLALRAVVGVVEGIERLGDGGAVPAAQVRVWARGGLVDTLGGSHGSFPWVIRGKTTVGKRA